MFAIEPISIGLLPNHAPVVSFLCHCETLLQPIEISVMVTLGQPKMLTSKVDAVHTHPLSRGVTFL